MADQSWAKLPFKEGIDFFKQKKALPTATWRDIEKGAHDRAFVVAGLTRMSALEEIHTVIHKQMQTGISYEKFRKEFNTIIDRAGWEPKNREWRTRLIFETNIRTAYSAGQWAQLQDPSSKALIYIQYKHSGAEHFRPIHKSWDNLVLPRTDKFWETNLPINEWGCKCTWLAISARSLKRMGKDGPDQNPYDVARAKGEPTTYEVNDPATGKPVTLPRGVGLGWNYRPGESWLRGVTPLPTNALTGNRIIPNFNFTDAMVPPRAFLATDLLPAGLTEEQLYARFAAEFGGAPGQSVFFDDKIDNIIPINDALFKDAAGAWKIKKDGRDEWLVAIARALRDPDEIFALLEWREKEQLWKLKLRYIAQYVVPGKDQPLIAIFDRGKDYWEGTTAFVENERNPAYVANHRQGVRLYRRVPQ